MRGIDPTRRVIVLLMRSLVVLAIAVMLAGPQLRREHDDLTVIGLLDVSGSVRRFARIPDPDGDAPERRTYLDHFREWFRAATATRAPGDRPSKTELAIARVQGRTLAEVARAWALRP